MAQQHGMIEPFESGQIRDSEKGRVISYGTSSYGYDVRCSDEFKIFANINFGVPGYVPRHLRFTNVTNYQPR